MKTHLFIGLLAIIIPACGNSDDGQADRFLRATYGAPVELSEIPQHQQNLAAIMTKISEGEETELTVGEVLRYDEGNDYHAGIFESLPPGRYVTRIFIAYSSDVLAAKLADHQKVQYEATGGVPLGVYEVIMDIVVGQEEIIIDVAPKDFSLDIDTDGDGRSNLTEIMEQTNPYEAETEAMG